MTGKGNTVREAIAARLDELKMSAEEVLIRITEQAQGAAPGVTSVAMRRGAIGGENAGAGWQRRADIAMEIQADRNRQFRADQRAYRME